MNQQLPILYSFRRCPYAMRARLSLAYADIRCELREVVLRNKPEELLKRSPKATVPVLLLPNGTILEESYDILKWALLQNDPKDWHKNIAACDHWVEENDGSFKTALDKYKYSSRFTDDSKENYRRAGEIYLQKLEKVLHNHKFILGEVQSITDLALFPFIRQFAFVDKEWFDRSPYDKLKKWLDFHLESSEFKNIMQKYAPWQTEHETLYFPQ
jgi:glutathione S-transferase